MIGLLEITLFSIAMIAVMSWVAAVWASPRGASGELSPRARAMRARLWLYAPFWVPAVVVGATILPGLIAGFLGLADHCTRHDSHHHHLCFFHPPHISNHPVIWGLTAAIIGSALLLLVKRAVSVVHDLRLSTVLARSGRPSDLGSDIRLLDRSEPIALTVGVFRPVVLLSTGLVEMVPPRTLQVIIAHERAHVRRRDTLWASLDVCLSAVLPRDLRRRLLGDLALAREQACDQLAAETLGPRGKLWVASALTKVARLKLENRALAMSAAASSIEARVLYLLAEPSSSSWRLLAPAISVAGMIALGAGPIHGLIERVVTLLVH
ncbi:MAG: M56 family metallopeptidase [Myxococcales bacterium]|nr:M56 family metallopeptidase [Myxococcales bacterium]